MQIIVKIKAFSLGGYFDGRKTPVCRPDFVEYGHAAYQLCFNTYMFPAEIVTRKMKKQSIYQRTWFILILLLIFAPAGIGLMWWQKRNWNIVPKVLATLLAFTLFISAMSNIPSTETFAEATYNSLLKTVTPSTTTVNSTGTIATTTAVNSNSPTTSGSTSKSTTAASTTKPTTPKSVIAPAITTEMKVHFLDVGQGAATLFEIGDKVMLIDGGDRDQSSFVVAYLKKQGIEQIDVIIATHYDADHINGLVGALNVFPVNQVYDANNATDTRVFNSFKNVIQEKQIPETIPGMRQSIQLGDATVTFVAPRQYGHATGNDDSICVRVQFSQTSFLIMGDPSADAEQQILTQNLKSDVFYASHHGSNGSNSKTLLANVDPDFAVISCGIDNQYGHPGDNTLARIKNIGAALYRTDQQGTFIATSNGQTITWSHKPCNDFTPGAATTATTAPKSTTIIATTIPAATGGAEQAYVLNTNTKKFHYPSCGSAATIKLENRQDVVSTRDAIIAQGFIPCKNCNP
jgi:competence protein ComEC